MSLKLFQSLPFSNLHYFSLFHTISFFLSVCPFNIFPPLSLFPSTLSLSYVHHLSFSIPFLSLSSYLTSVCVTSQIFPIQIFSIYILSPLSVMFSTFNRTKDIHKQTADAFISSQTILSYLILYSWHSQPTFSITLMDGLPYQSYSQHFNFFQSYEWAH